MRISDWSSDVCSSDLDAPVYGALGRLGPGGTPRPAAVVPRAGQLDLDPAGHGTSSKGGWTNRARAGARRGATTVPAASPTDPAVPRWEIGRASGRERVCQYV